MIVFAKQTICTQISIIMKHKIKFDRFNYAQLRNLGSKFNLSFSSYIALGNKIIGLDVLKRKVLIAEKIDGLFRPYFIELNKVSVITVQKIYNSIKAGDLKKKKIGEFLQSIRLQLEFENGENTIVLPFYERTIDDIHNLQWLESKARNWQMMLSKMLRGKIAGSSTKKDNLN
jgi:hypothetical protein